MGGVVGIASSAVVDRPLERLWVVDGMQESRGRPLTAKVAKKTFVGFPLSARDNVCARDSLRLRSGQVLAALVKARGFEMTPDLVRT